jgi:8-oxo-dGTP pyrophosphatase MutT (NUDIX family)
VSIRPGYGVRLESVRQLLDTHVPVAVVEADWPSGLVRLSAYLGVADLPAEIPGRVRCLVTDGESVLVIWDIDGRADCFPGGGIQDGESVALAAEREVWEETGWRIHADCLAVLGWIHIESLGERAPDFRFPYPDAFMTVVHARPSHREEGPEVWTDLERYVVRSQFTALEELPEKIGRDPISTAFLRVVFGDAWPQGGTRPEGQ